MATTLDSLVVRLVGDGSSYKKMLDHAAKDTENSAKIIKDQTTALTRGFANQSERMSAAHRAAASAVKQTGVAYKEALAQAMIGIRRAEQASWKFMSTTEKLKATVKGLSRALKSAGSGMKSFGGSIAGMGTKLSLMVTLPLKLMGLAAVKSATDAAESLNKMSATFSDVLPKANKEIDLLNKNYMMSRSQAVKLMGDTGDLLTGFGFQQQETVELSSQVQKLAADLASFSNIQGGVTRASRAITKALLGEREMLKDLGVVVRENDPQYKSLIKHFKDLKGLTDNQAKAQATLVMIFRQSPNAIGDVAKTFDQLANQARAMGGNMKDMMNEFGKILIPFFSKVTQKIRSVTIWLTTLDEKWKKIIIVVGVVAGVIGPLMVAFGMATVILGSFVTAISAIWAGLTFIGTALAGISVPVIAVVAKIGVLIAAIIAIGAVTVAWFIWPEKTEKVLRVVRRLFSVFTGWLAGVFFRFFTSTLPGWIKTGFEMAWKFLTGVLPKLAKMFWDALTGKTVDWGSIFDGIKEDFGAGFEGDLVGNVKNILDEEDVNMPNLSGKVKKGKKLIDDYRDKALEANELFDQATEHAGDPAVKAAGKADKALGSMIDSMKSKLAGLTEGEEGVSKIESLEKAGGSKDMVLQAKGLEAKIKRQKKMNEMQKKGADMMKKFRTPQAKFSETTKELNDLLAGGHIDMDTFTKSHKEAEKQLKSDLKIKFSTSGIDGALADSTEAMARVEAFRAQASGAINIPTAQDISKLGITGTLGKSGIPGVDPSAGISSEPKSTGWLLKRRVDRTESHRSQFQNSRGDEDVFEGPDYQNESLLTESGKLTEAVELLKRIADKTEEEDPSKTTIVAEASFKP